VLLMCGIIRRKIFKLFRFVVLSEPAAADDSKNYYFKMDFPAERSEVPTIFHVPGAEDREPRLRV